MATLDATVTPPPAAAPPTTGTSPGAKPGERTGTRGLAYIPGLDGIRAIAVLAVLLYHADVPWMPGGFLGVDMFFVLSGFLITSIVLTELDKSGRLDFKRFYIHRGRRLLPALFAVLIFSAVLAAIFAPDAAATLRRDIPAALFYATNWVYVIADQSYFELTGRPPLLQHLWSLAVEEQFYLIWPAVAVFLFRRGGRSRVREWALIGAVASTIIMIVLSFLGGYPEPNDGSRVYFGTDSHAMGLLIGAALATVWIPQRLGNRVAAGARILIDAVGLGALAVAILIMMTSHSNASWLYWGGFTVFSVVVAAVIAATSHPASLLGRALGTQPLKYIGQRSYGLYLWHWPVFMVLRPGLDVPLEGFANLVLRFAVTFGLAELSYRYIEMPIRRGRLKAAWQRFRALPADQREPMRKKAAIIGTVALLFGTFVGYRVVTLPPAEADYLHGLESVSALDATPGKHEKSSGDPQLSGTVTAPGVTTVKPGILAVGESVMLGAQGGLRDDFKKIAIDAAVGRQASDILTRVQELRDAGALRETVILHTGSNGYVERSQLKQILQVLSVAQRIVVVNVDVPREWQNPNNELIAEMVAQTPNAVLADWHSRAQAEGDVHVSDGIHLTEQGVAAYSETINQALTTLTDAQATAPPAPTTAPVPAPAPS
ncbi:MAG: acyltransferase family protein [Candidatus Nanopelagicales bacterium]